MKGRWAVEQAASTVGVQAELRPQEQPQGVFCVSVLSEDSLVQSMSSMSGVHHLMVQARALHTPFPWSLLCLINFGACCDTILMQLCAPRVSAHPDKVTRWLPLYLHEKDVYLSGPRWCLILSVPRGAAVVILLFKNGLKVHS